jgi:Cys-tRNA(Pro)/Cys-tRNA(Cys) deacylase
MSAKNTPFKNTAFKNNVTRMLDSKRVPYTVYTYDYDAGVHSAVEVAQAIGLPSEQVFKTLVAVADQPRSKPLLVAVPGSATLNLKALAKTVGVKKIKMAEHKQAEQLTKLQTGGISPLALINKGFDVYLDARARAYETIAVSAGERGVNIELPVAELVKLTRARWVDVA